MRIAATGRCSSSTPWALHTVVLTARLSSKAAGTTRRRLRLTLIRGELGIECTVGGV